MEEKTDALQLSMPSPPFRCLYDPYSLVEEAFFPWTVRPYLPRKRFLENYFPSIFPTAVFYGEKQKKSKSSESPDKDSESSDSLPGNSSGIESKTNRIGGRGWPFLSNKSGNEDSHNGKVSMELEKQIARELEINNYIWDIDHKLAAQVQSMALLSSEFQALCFEAVESRGREKEGSNPGCSDASSSESLHSDSFESSSNGSESSGVESSSDCSETLHSESFSSCKINSVSELLNEKLPESQPGKSEEPHSTTGQHSGSDSEESVSDSSESPSEKGPIIIDATYTAGPFSDNYTHLKLLCKGTFGCVAKGYRNSDGLLVFTKFIRKSSVYNDVLVYDCKLQKNVPIEVSILQGIKHPNIINVFDVFENDDYYHLVMEKHGIGMDLFTFIGRNTCREEPLICYIFRQMVDALSYLHALNVVHRDVKDENCLINENFQVKLIDFGSAGFVSEEKFTTFYGTKEYCSPEVLRGEKYCGPELEVFALGITLYTLAFGDIPFKDKEAILIGEYTFPKDASEALVNLIEGMLEPVAEHRLILPEVEINNWVNQEVEIQKYSFADVVNANKEDLHTCKYVRVKDLEDISLEDGGLSYLKSLSDVVFKYPFCCV